MVYGLGHGVAEAQKGVGPCCKCVVRNRGQCAGGTRQHMLLGTAGDLGQHAECKVPQDPAPKMLGAENTP